MYICIILYMIGNICIYMYISFSLWTEYRYRCICIHIYIYTHIFINVHVSVLVGERNSEIAWSGLHLQSFCLECFWCRTIVLFVTRVKFWLRYVCNSATLVLWFVGNYLPIQLTAQFKRVFAILLLARTPKHACFFQALFGGWLYWF